MPKPTQVPAAGAGWISVEDRLPEDARKILLFGIYQNTYLGQWHSSKNAFTNWCGGGLHSITHWMPLPEPPTLKPAMPEVG